MNRRRLSTTSFTLIVVAAAIISLSAMSGIHARADIPATEASPAAKPTALALPVLHLNNGDYATGTLAECDDPNLLRWQCAAATEPFDFFLSSVSGIYFPVQKDPVKAAGDFSVELAGGDTVFGALAGISAKEVVIQSPLLGMLHIDRKSVLRLVRRSGATEIVYSGPRGLTDWTQPLGASDWREEAGELVTDRAGASLLGNVPLPAQASIDIDLSWKHKPDFVLAFGTAEADEKPQVARPGNSAVEYPYSISTLDSSLIACRESVLDADIAQLRTLTSGAGQLHLHVILDQERGQMRVYAENGKLLGSVAVAEAKPHVERGIRIVNRQGDLRVERLRVSRGSASAAQDFAATAPGVSKADGSIVEGEVESADASSRQLVVNGAAGAIRIDVNQANIIVLAPRNDSKPSGAAMRIALNDGECLSGKLEKVGKNQLSFSFSQVSDPVSIPLTSLQSIVVLSHDSFTPQEPGRTGRLELEGVRLKGCLQESHQAANPDASCLVWHPQSSQTGAALRSDVSGRIVYRDPPPAPPKNVQAVQQGQRQVVIQNGGVLMLQGARIQGPVVLNAVVGAIDPQAQPGAAAAASGPSGPALYLRAGDVIPCRVTSITEEGVHFQSSITDAKFVPNSHVKAVELIPNAAPRPLDKTRRERLLTLPRMQRDNPPTQLVVSTNGDYLRGRLSEMDDRMLKMEVQLENRQLARSRVAKIIWFHQDELDGAAKPAEEPAAAGLRVQAQRNDGVRLTFSPQRMNNMAISGASDVLGPCRVDLTQVDQLLIGGAIEQGAAKAPYSRWRLHHAKEPLFAQDNPQEGPNPNAGMQSPLVGKPAPDFELKLLDGGKFRLSQHKGHVVVLDFWATWCGPCVNAMPQVDKAIEELKDQNVELVAVNMQEDPKAVQTLLDRLELKPTVALDSDGKTAEKYAVTGIPQTVVIDPEGNIARLFIGAGPTFGEQLSASLKDVLGKGASPADSAAPAEPTK